MAKERLGTLLEAAVRKHGETLGIELPDSLEVGFEVPKNPNHGDYATNLAMTLARTFKAPPQKIATAIVENVPENDLIAKLEVAGPGYINISLDVAVFHKALEAILRDGTAYGRQESDETKRTQIEFVSANPTGPLNVVNGRAASLGDSLARVFRYCGIPADREFYINDAGNQVRLFGESLKAHMASLSGDEHPFPEEGYQGEYVKEMAKEHLATLKDQGASWKDAEVAQLSRFGTDAVLANQREDLREFRVEYECWFSEKTLHDAGKVQAAFEMLQKRGEVYEEDGGQWLRTSKYGDEKDRILIKSDGTPTYFIADIAYHLDKFERGYQRVIDIWGPDHHGHVIRMQAAMEACGIEKGRLIILIAQTVRLKKGDELVKFSKRKGEFYSLRELMEDTDINSMRYFFVSRRFDTHLDFDIALAQEISEKNPAYYIQYVHARVCSILRKAKERGISPKGDMTAARARLTTADDKNLIFALSQFPEQVQRAADNFEPHHIAYALRDLGKLFHKYYHDHYILHGDDDPELTQARLALVLAVRNIFALGLDLIGLDAPEKM